MRALLVSQTGRLDMVIREEGRESATWRGKVTQRF